MRKKDIHEIIDGDDNLIGSKTTPDVNNNAETMANGTTDQNIIMHGQNFKNDFLGRFGFTFFAESENDDNNLREKTAKIMYGKYLQSLDYYYKNPDKLKSDYDKHFGDEDINFEDNMNEVDYEWADTIIEIFEPHMKNQIDESTVAEEKILDKDKKKKKGLKKDKDDDHELNFKAKRVADLIEKLPEKDREKLKAILEQ